MSDEAGRDQERPTRRRTSKARAKSCPVCGRTSADRFRPFCSARCADIDLGRWLKGNYSIPTDEAPDDDGGEHDDDEI